LIAEDRDPLAPSEESAYEAALVRRARREPVAYITGAKEFFSLTFAVDARVLVPRPETETLVEAAVAFLRERLAAGGTPVVLDVGTGSGAIAVAIAHAVAAYEPASAMRLVALDCSGEALALARDNARRLLVRPPALGFFRGDLTHAVRAESADLVAANPPYLAAAEIAGGAPELAWEPRTALDGGSTDGLGVVRELLADARRVLRAGGRILCEIGAAQAERAVELAERSGFVSARVLRDLAGAARVLVAEVPAGSS
jgi:release factor glutamine methyltransferase